MSMRSALLAAGLAAATFVPLQARASDRPTGEVADKLSDPGTQLAVAAALAAMSEALLDIRVEPFVRAMDRMDGDARSRDLPPDARLRDVAGPGARRMPGKIAREVPQAMGEAAGMAGAVDDMLPELKAMARRLKDAIPKPRG